MLCIFLKNLLFYFPFKSRLIVKKEHNNVLMALWSPCEPFEVKWLILLENQLIMAVHNINHIICGKRTMHIGYIIKSSVGGNKGINAPSVGNDIFVSFDAPNFKTVKIS